LPAGLYAFFVHKGPADDGFKIYNYILKEWLPNSSCQLDNRPHFTLMAEKHKNNNPESKEKIWIPVKELNELL